MSAASKATYLIDTYGLDAIEDLIKSFKAGESAASIARKMGVSAATVKSWKKELGAPGEWRAHKVIRRLSTLRN